MTVPVYVATEYGAYERRWLLPDGGMSLTALRTETKESRP